VFPTRSTAAPPDDRWPAPRGRRLALAAATAADLAAVRAHVEGACRHACVEAEACEALALATDELCTNVLVLAYARRPGPLTVDVGVDATPAPSAPAEPRARPGRARAGRARRRSARRRGVRGALDRPTRRPARRPGRGRRGRLPRGRDRRRPAVRSDHPPGRPRATPDRTGRAARPGGLGWRLVRASVDRIAYARTGGCNVVTLERRCGRPPATSLPQPAPSMQISIAHERDVTVVAVTGSLDALTADTLDDALLGEVRAGRTRLVAALDGLEYTSSAGLRVLLGAVKAARQRGGDLRVAGAQPRVERVLALSGFTGILRCFPDVSSAVASWAP
jgi:anti-sigma B factor antagonist